MTNSQKAYRKFLASDFWKELSTAKKCLNPTCECCGSKHRLQAHHVFYPKDWNDTTLQMLQTLCNSCHKEAHGIRTYLYSDDPLLEHLYWKIHDCWKPLHKGRNLKAGAIRFLNFCKKLYPKERPFQFQVRICLEHNKLCRY